MAKRILLTEIYNSVPTIPYEGDDAPIRQQFPHVTTLVLPSVDTRNAPRHYFISIGGAESTAPSLIIHSPYEWTQAVLAWEVLK